LKQKKESMDEEASKDPNYGDPAAPEAEVIAEDPYSAEGSAKDASRRISLSQKAYDRVSKAGGGVLVLCVSSFLVMVHSARTLNSGSSGIDKYALTVGLLPFLLTLTLLIHQRRPLLGVLDKKIIFSSFFFSWFLAAVLILSFQIAGTNFDSKPFNALSTPYLSLWVSALISAILLQQDASKFKGALDRLENRANEGGAPFLGVIAYVIIFVEAVVVAAPKSALVNYAIAQGVIGCLLTLSILLLRSKLEERELYAKVLQFNFFWALVGLIMLTTGDGPFQDANNGFFAIWGSLATAAAMIRNNGNAQDDVV